MMISMDKEGDSTILFRNSEGIPLAELTFTLCEYQGKGRCLLADCKAQMGNSTPEIQNATKACHGLFPKRLVMEAACLFAQRLQVEQIIAVSNETHIYRSLRYRDKEGKIHADYNAFWESVGGVCDAERHYRLPAQIARKEIAEIASKNGLNTVGAMRCSTLFSHKWPRCFVVSRPDRAPATARVRTFFSSVGTESTPRRPASIATSMARSGLEERWIAFEIILRRFIGIFSDEPRGGTHRKIPGDT